MFATHLNLHEPEGAPDAPAARKFGALQLAWDLLHPAERGGISRGDPAVRVLVIDAFAAPQPQESQDALRRDVVALVQALESEGVSTVLVEETLGDAPSFLPFVVDIVFELAWTADADTGELTRKLRCTKCRNAVARPGPHDYGVEDGRLCVWPDVLLAVEPEASMRIAEPLRLAHLVEGSLDVCAVLTNGGVLLAPTDGDGRHIEIAVTRTPGARRLEVRCGSVATLDVRKPGPSAIEEPVLAPTHQWTDSMGVAALGWMLFRHLKDGVNVVTLREPQRLLARAHQGPAVMRLIDGLRALGALVVLSASSADLQPFTGMNDLPRAVTTEAAGTWPFRTVLWRRGVKALIASFSRTLASMGEAQGLTMETRTRYSDLAGLASRVADAGPLTMDFAQEIRQRAVDLPGGDSGVHHLIRLLRWYAGTLDKPTKASTPMAAWVFALLGHRARAFRFAYELDPARDNFSGLFWSAFAAERAGNRHAMERLKRMHGLAGELALEPRFRALARWGTPDELKEASEHLGGLNTGDGDCVFYESVLGHAQPDSAFMEAVLKYSQLSIDNTYRPDAERADIAWNLGLAIERLGFRNAASPHYARAVRLNPSFLHAQAQLERLAKEEIEPAPDDLRTIHSGT
ncbi:MAG: hypothetical protein R3B70_02085 [Polyangiaceae bacterium]